MRVGTTQGNLEAKGAVNSSNQGALKLVTDGSSQSSKTNCYKFELVPVRRPHAFLGDEYSRNPTTSTTNECGPIALT